MVIWARLALGLAVSGAVLVLGSAACGTDAVGIESCRKVEEARCRQAPGCNISLATPVHQGDDVEACIRYYDDACLHGLEAPDPGAPSVDACVRFIDSQTDCNIVLHP